MRFLKRHAKNKPFFVLGILVLAWLLIPTAVKRFARTSFFEFRAPVDTAASYVHDLQDFWSYKTRSKNELIRVGKEIAQLNAAYEVRLQTDDTLREDIERLESLLNMPTPPGYRTETARIVNRNISRWWQQITIRKGQIHGIMEGCPVIYAGGVVGRVSEVHTYTSVVELSSNSHFRISAIVEGDPRPVSYQGSAATTFGSPKGTIEYIPPDIDPEQADRLLTSGLGGIFPPNLFIGTIVHLEAEKDGLFQHGEVILNPELSYLREVSVLIPLEGN